MSIYLLPKANWSFSALNVYCIYCRTHWISHPAIAVLLPNHSICSFAPLEDDPLSRHTIHCAMQFTNARLEESICTVIILTEFNLYHESFSFFLFLFLSVAFIWNLNANHSDLLYYSVCIFLDLFPFVVHPSTRIHPYPRALQTNQMHQNGSNFVCALTT